MFGVYILDKILEIYLKIVVYILNGIVRLCKVLWNIVWRVVFIRDDFIEYSSSINLFCIVLVGRWILWGSFEYVVVIIIMLSWWLEEWYGNVCVRL